MQNTELKSPVSQSTSVATIILVPLLFISIFITALNTHANESSSEKRALLEQLRQAQSESEGRKIEGEIWELWFSQAPTAEIRESLDAGMSRRDSYDYEAAENYFDDVVAAAPNYAEGYNQRAFARFLREDFEGSKKDLEKTLELEPDHFGALSGMYHILRIENRHKAALGFLQKAVSLHPWIQERFGLPEEMWPEHYRQLQEESI